MNTAPSQQLLFQHMTRLTLFQGIVIGLLVAVFGLMLAPHVSAFSVDAPLVTVELLPLLAYLLLGVASLLQWRRERLRTQFPMFVPPRGGGSASERATISLVMALTGFGLAGLQLFGIVFSLDLSQANWLFIYVVALLCASAVVWYFHQRDHRQAPHV